MKIVDVNKTERDCVSAYPDKDYPGYMRVEFKTEVRSHHIWYPIAEFIKNNPSLEKLTKNAPAVTAETVGVVTSSTENSLTDSKQKWTKNAYLDFPVWISRGSGEGQIRTVISNTGNTIKIDKVWDTLPNKSSQYVLSYNIHDPQPLGNNLPEKDNL